MAANAETRVTATVVNVKEVFTGSTGGEWILDVLEV